MNEQTAGGRHHQEMRRSLRIAVALWGFALIPTQAFPDASRDLKMSFREITTAGFSYQNVLGHPKTPYIIESTGNGVAWFDYDNDGWLDLFVANGSTLERLSESEPGPANQLYRNRRDGTFANVTDGSDLVGDHWAGAVAMGHQHNDVFGQEKVRPMVEAWSRKSPAEIVENNDTLLVAPKCRRAMGLVAAVTTFSQYGELSIQSELFLHRSAPEHSPGTISSSFYIRRCKAPMHWKRAHKLR